MIINVRCQKYNVSVDDTVMQIFDMGKYWQNWFFYLPKSFVSKITNNYS